MDKVGETSHLTIRIAGPDAEALESDLQDFLRQELDQEGTRVEPGTLEESGTRGEGMQLAQLMLTIPISTVAILTLSDRLRVVPMIRKLLALVRGREPEGNQVTLASSQDSIELNHAEEAEVMELIASASRPESDE